MSEMIDVPARYPRTAPHKDVPKDSTQPVRIGRHLPPHFPPRTAPPKDGTPLRTAPLLRSTNERYASYKNASLFHFRISIDTPDGWFFVHHSRPAGWFHVVVNYIGPNNGDGVRIFYDGVEVASETTRDPSSLPGGDGRIVVGRVYSDVNDH